MPSVAELINRFVGPLFAGVFMAALASTADQAAGTVLFLFAAASAFVSLPGNDRLLARLFDRLV